MWFDKSQLRGRYYDTTLDNFLMTMNISVYSFVAVAQFGGVSAAAGQLLLLLRHLRRQSPRLHLPLRLPRRPRP